VELAVEIANTTLDFARDTPDRVPVKISRVLDEVVRFYGRKIRYKRVDVKVRHNFDGEIMGSPGEIRQIFSNLLVNSLEAVERERGVIKVHSYGCHNLTNTAQRGMRVIVADNGPGIPEETRRQIFLPFFTTKNSKGTGLGLWIVNALVKKYGGSVHLRSSVRRPRTGTCFSVFLPC
jgi:signal transduction histidine kinase